MNWKLIRDAAGFALLILILWGVLVIGGALYLVP